MQVCRSKPNIVSLESAAKYGLMVKSLATSVLVSDDSSATSRLWWKFDGRSEVQKTPVTIVLAFCKAGYRFPKHEQNDNHNVKLWGGAPLPHGE